MQLEDYEAEVHAHDVLLKMYELYPEHGLWYIKKV
jgi:hypothetical protein